jgi:Flp pilus assembly protein TadG
MTPMFYRKIEKRNRSKGQAIILITLTFVTLMLFLGIVVDLGQVFIAKAYLRKATDSASLAAAAQFREGRTIPEMEATARQLIKMNGLTADTVVVETCSTTPTDTVLCEKDQTMPKKLVRVTISINYPLTFMTLVNIYSVPLVDTSVSEAASMDVVLVLDISESMAWYDNAGVKPNPPIDPADCNPANTCNPFKYVKSSADYFTQKILNKSAADEEDRMALVTFASGWDGSTTIINIPGSTLNWTTDSAAMTTAIDNLNVYQASFDCADWSAWEGFARITPTPDTDSIPLGPCAQYGPDMHKGDAPYKGLACPFKLVFETNKPEAVSACDTTNIAGGLFIAGNQFSQNKRSKALWVVILLTDGEANATELTSVQAGMSQNQLKKNLPVGFCPSNTWVQGANLVYCQDGHAGVGNPLSKDAEDEALIAANFVGSSTGLHAVIFTIGLGPEVKNKLDLAGNSYGDTFLARVAEIGNDGATGNYFWTNDGSGLQSVFEQIASRIFTRLTQ